MLDPDGRPVSQTWRVGTREFVGLLATVSALTALAIDLVLPAFSDVREHFELAPDSPATARIVTFFFFGFAGQIFFGPLSDRFGRLPIMRTGFVLYAVGCVATALAPNLTFMLGARLLWGTGAGALQVSSLAMIRDRYQGDEMARIMSFVLAIFLITPMVAPVIGRVVLGLASWRVVFLVPLAGAGVVFAWSLRLLESLPRSHRIDGLHPAALFASARLVVGQPRTARFIIAQTAAFAGFSSYLASSERIIGQVYDREELFVPIFVGVSILMVALTSVNALVVTRLGARRAAAVISAIAVVVTAALLGFAAGADGVPSLAVFLLLFPLMVSLNGMAEPNFGALAMEPQGERAGIAAAVYGSSYIAGGSLIGAVVDGLIDSSINPLVWAFLIAAVLALILIELDRRAQGGETAIV